MTSAHSLFVLSQGRKLKHLAAKGRLTTAALTAAGGAIMANSQAQAHSKSRDIDEAQGYASEAVVGQGLVGATHTHASGLQHNHGPLSWLPNGVQHTHPFDAASMMQAPVSSSVAGPLSASSGSTAPQMLGGLPMAYNGGMMSAPGAYVSQPAMGSSSVLGGGLLDGGMLLGLGLAGLTGLAAMVFFDGGHSAGHLPHSDPNYTPYLDPDPDPYFDPDSFHITTGSTQQADEGERGTLDTISAHHPLGHSVTCSIIGGSDDERFTIDSDTGELSFIGARAPEEGDANNSVPDYSVLSGDADGTDPENGNNTLEVVVQVTDEFGNTASREITYYIQNDRRDDTVDGYREADDIPRLSDDDTNNLTDITDAEIGQDDNGDFLVISVDGDDHITATQLDGDGDAHASNFGTSGVSYVDVAVGDIDGDGDLDVVAAGRDGGDNFVEVWESNGSGNFSRELTIDDGSGASDLDENGTIADVVLGEFTGSGDLDIFVSNDGGEDSLITLSGNYSADVETVAGLDAAADAVVVSENYINSSTDYVAALNGSGDIAWIDVEDGIQEDLIPGSYVDLAVYRDMVFAAVGDSVDVFEADSNSLESETSGLITGLDNVAELVIGDFDNDGSDMELAILDAGTNKVYIYELDQHYDSASLLEIIDVSATAVELLTIPENTEAMTESGGNLADDLLVGGSSTTIYYDDTSL